MAVEVTRWTAEDQLVGRAKGDAGFLEASVALRHRDLESSRLDERTFSPVTIVTPGQDDIVSLAVTVASDMFAHPAR